MSKSFFRLPSYANPDHSIYAVAMSHNRWTPQPLYTLLFIYHVVGTDGLMGADIVC